MDVSLAASQRVSMDAGMPEFGSLYTDEEWWAMVKYLRIFLFLK